MITKEATVSLDDGLSARSIALLVQTASRYEAVIRLSDGQKRMNAKSIMGMMALGLALGDIVTIEAEGTDEEEAASAIAEFLEGK